MTDEINFRMDYNRRVIIISTLDGKIPHDDYMKIKEFVEDLLQKPCEVGMVNGGLDYKFMPMSDIPPIIN